MLLQATTTLLFLFTLSINATSDSDRAFDQDVRNILLHKVTIEDVAKVEQLNLETTLDPIPVIAEHNLDLPHFSFRNEEVVIKNNIVSYICWYQYACKPRSPYWLRPGNHRIAAPIGGNLMIQASRYCHPSLYSWDNGSWKHYGQVSDRSSDSEMPMINRRQGRTYGIEWHPVKENYVLLVLPPYMNGRRCDYELETALLFQRSTRALQCKSFI